MRWPIRNQVLAPMLAVQGAVVLCLSLLSAHLASNAVARQMEDQARSVQRTLSESRFPLTDRVLEQMAGLSGAEYVVVNAEGQLQASSDPRLATALVKYSSAKRDRGFRKTRLSDRTYYHRRLVVDRRRLGGTQWELHVLFPSAAYDEAWRRAVYPPLVVGAVAWIVVGLVSWRIARRVTDPLARLQRHVAKVAHGDFQPLEVPARRDEVRELVLAINRMAELLARYETNVRKAERMETLAHLGSSMAHQIRNAATGCRLALDLHRRHLSDTQGESEELTLAREQLERIERFLERFLQLGRSAGDGEWETEGGLAWTFRSAASGNADVQSVVESAVRQVRPLAEHWGVVLQVDLIEWDDEVAAPADLLEQALVNLLRNAVEAAAEHAHRACPVGAKGPATGTDAAHVRLSCRTDGDFFEFLVADSGLGPSPQIAERLFEPFATDKRGGAGLGLALVAWLAESCGGEVSWSREEPETCFRLKLPRTGGDS